MALRKNFVHQDVSLETVPPSVQAWVGQLLSSRWVSPFGRFYTACVNSTLDWMGAIQRIGTGTPPSGGDGPVFPMPLPFGDALAEEEGFVSGKRFATKRELRRRRARQLANLLVCLSNFYEMGAPRGSGPMHFAVRPLSTAQEAAAARFLADAEAFGASSGGDISAAGRGRAKLNDLILEASSRYSEAGRRLRNCGQVSTVALEVRPEQVSLPTRAGHLRGCEVMCPERAAVFRDLSKLELPPDEISSARIRACHKIGKSEEIDFVKTLLTKGMAVLLEEDEIARHPLSQEMLRGGFFGVPHKPGRMRLIYDRRPANAIEKELSSSWLCLPHGSQFCELVLAPNEGIRSSCADLECWFYQLRHEAEHFRRQAVGRRLEGCDFTNFGAVEGKRYRCCLTVVAMGDANGVAYSQEAHEFVLKAAGLLGVERTLRFGEPVPLTDTLEGAYVDDHVFAQRLPLSRLQCFPGHSDTCPGCCEDNGRLADVRLCEELDSAYDAYDIVQSKSKGVKFSSRFTAWGTTVDGRGGTAAVDIEKRRQLSRLVFAVVRRGFVSKVILQSLIGSLVHPLMHARNLMCALNGPFRFLASMTPNEEVRMPAAVIDELIATMLWLSRAYTDLRTQVSNTLSATDATTVRGGRCDCVIPEKLARALWRRGERRGESGKLRWTELEQSLLPTRMQKPDQELADVVTSLPWQCAEGFDFDGPQRHIHIQELRAVISEIDRTVSNGAERERVTICVGSRVVTGAVAKGRSSSRMLNSWLRRLTVRCLGARIQLRLLWVDTHSNPADAPSRHAPLPPRTNMLDWVEKTFTDAASVAQRSYSKHCQPVVVPNSVPGLPHCRVVGAGKTSGRAISISDAHTRRKPTFREYFSGCGRLSQEIRRGGSLRV